MTNPSYYRVISESRENKPYIFRLSPHGVGIPNVEVAAISGEVLTVGDDEFRVVKTSNSIISDEFRVFVE